VSLTSLYYRAATHGRLTMPAGHLSNPNDLAQVLLMGVPFWFLMGASSERAPFRRIIAGACVLPILYVILLSGSRGVLLALVILGATFYWRLSIGKKLALALPMMLAMVVALVALPQDVRDRYKTIFTGGDARDVKYDDDTTVEAVAQASAAQRKQLL